MAYAPLSVRAMNRPGTLLAVVALPIWGACAPDSSVPVDPLDLDAAPGLTLSEELRLGSFDDPVEGFTRIFGVVVDAEGRMFVGDAGDYAIRVYAPDGSSLGRIGGRGEGPGEFSTLPTFGVRNGTLWATDFRNGRLTLFSTEGELLSSRVIEDSWIPARTGSLAMRPIGMDEDGLFVTWPGGVRYSGETGVDAPLPRLRINGEGETVDTAGFLPSPPPRLVPPADHESDFRFIDVDGRRYMVPQPPSQLDNWMGLVDGHVVMETPWPDGDRGEVTLTRIGLAGDTLYARTFTYGTEPYREADLESIARVVAEGRNIVTADGTPIDEGIDDETAARALDRLLQEMSFPTHRPDIEYAEAMPDGSLWIRRRGPADADTKRWVVVGPRGQVRGQIELPPTARPRTAVDDRVWVVEPDEFDVPWLVRYRIEG